MHCFSSPQLSPAALFPIHSARAIYVHGASLADPRADKSFWDEWNAFEVKHGNEETFR